MILHALVLSRQTVWAGQHDTLQLYNWSVTYSIYLFKCIYIVSRVFKFNDTIFMLHFFTDQEWLGKQHHALVDIIPHNYCISFTLLHFWPRCSTKNTLVLKNSSTFGLVHTPPLACRCPQPCEYLLPLGKSCPAWCMTARFCGRIWLPSRNSLPEGCKQKTRSEEFVINMWQQKCLEQYQSLKGCGKEYVNREKWW